MFSQVLKIIPQLDGSALADMERKLTTRFARVAKKFGSGLKTAIMGGGVTAFALGIIDKILNPLKETQEAMDKILHRSDDLSTFAKQFGTTEGNLFKLEQMGKAKGLDPEELRTLMVKFQGAVVQAKANPTEPSAVRNFVNEKDMAEAFFQFIQGLGKMSDAQKVFIQTQVFGEKQIGKMSEFLNTPDFAFLQKDLKLGSGDSYTPGIKKAASLADQEKINATNRDTMAFTTQSTSLSPAMLQAKDKLAKQQDAQDAKRLKSYMDLEAMQLATDKMSKNVEDLYLMVLKNVPEITQALSEISKSRLLRFLKGFGD